MPNQQLIDYIKQATAQGQSREQIKATLLGAGWQEGDIERAFGGGVSSTFVPPPRPMTPTASSSPYSTLQQRFPLSPRKWWKKMIEKLLPLLFFMVVVGAMTLPVFFLSQDATVEKISGWVFVAVIIFTLLVMLVYGWYFKVYIRRYYYDGQEHFIAIKKGVFAPTEIHVQWQKIQDVYVDQDILDRIMGLYDVHIASATATSGIEAHIDGVGYEASEGLKNFILNKMLGTKASSARDPLQPNNTQQQQPQSAINFGEEISSKVYPIEDGWRTLSFVSIFLTSFVISGFFALIILAEFAVSNGADYWMYYVLGWLAVSILLAIIRMIKFLLWQHNYTFNFTPEHIYYRTGVISISEKHMPYSSIQDVMVRQGIIERIFGYARVVIQNAAQQTFRIENKTIQASSSVTLMGIPLDGANKISGLLRSQIFAVKSSQYGL